MVADIQGFDEFMNVVLDETEEVYDCSAKPGKEVKPRRSLGELQLHSDYLSQADTCRTDPPQGR